MVWPGLGGFGGCVFLIGVWGLLRSQSPASLALSSSGCGHAPGEGGSGARFDLEVCKNYLQS